MSACPANNSCSRLCSLNDDGVEVCSCERGYSLDNDNITCTSKYCIVLQPNTFTILILLTDINECDADGACNQNCNDTEGSFVCSCFIGYSLGSDGRTCNGEEGPYVYCLFYHLESFR